MQTMYLACTARTGPGSGARGSGVAAPPAGFIEPGFIDPGFIEAATLRPYEAIGTAEVDDSTTLAARPRGVSVTAGFEVYVGGNLVPHPLLVGPLFVERSIDQALQRWGFSLAFADAVALWGSPYERFGPAMGNQEIDIYGVYRTATGVHRFPRIKGGLCDNMQASAGADGVLAVFNGLDKGGRRDRRVVTKNIPAGSGLRRDRVGEILLTEAGETDFAFTPDRPMNKEVQAVDTRALALVQEIFDASGRRMLYNRDGAAWNPRPGELGPIRMRLEPQDILFAYSVDVTFPGDVVTDATLTGTQQVTRTAAEASGRTVSPPTSIEIKAFYATAVASSVQSVTGSLTPLSGPGARALIPVSLTLYWVESQDGVVVAEIEEEWGYEWLEAARYTWTSGVLNPRGGVYLGEDGTEDGAEPAYAEPFERWRKKQRKVTRHYYNKDGFRGPEGHGLVPWGDQLAASRGPGTEGHKLGSTTELWQHYQIRRALKGHVPGLSWEETDPLNGAVLGSGDAVAELVEQFRMVGRQTEVIEGEPVTGFQKSATTYNEGYDLRDGGLYWYVGGRESNEAQESFQLTGLQIQTFASPEQAGHIVHTTEYDRNGNIVGRPKTERKDGDRPAVPRIPEPEDATGLYEGEEEAAGQRVARRTESIPIKVRLIVPDLELTHERNEVKTSVPWAEDGDDLALLCETLIRRSAATAVVLALPVNFLIGEGDWLHVFYPDLLLDHDVEVQSIRDSMDGPRGARVSTLATLVYPREVTIGES